MKRRLEGKVAVVTGGASGMGLASVRRFLQEGASVVIADLNKANGEEALASCASAGYADQVRFLPVDVRNEDDVEAAVSLAVAEFGQLDIMFNNAGVGGAFGAITELHVDDWEYTYGVLVTGVFLGVKHAARQMIAQGWGGSIINTGSIAGEVGGGAPLCYSSAKAAVGHLGQVAAAELAPNNIRVNTIKPGLIETPLLMRTESEEAKKKMLSFVPAAVLGQPEDIAAVAVFYASDESKYVTGDSTIVDGGLLAASPGLVSQGVLANVPSGMSGANHGTTGQRATIRTEAAAPIGD